MELSTDPSEHLNENVVLVGVAENAKAGAVVLLADQTAVFIENLDYWDKKSYKKKMKVAGALRSRKLAPDPVVDAAGNVSAGMSGEALILEGARWEEV